MKKNEICKSFSNLDDIYRMTYDIEKELGSDDESARKFSKKVIERIAKRRIGHLLEDE